MNSKWWEFRLRYQGIIPPNQRTSDNFDAGAKYHVISDQDYIKYFVATVLQFQIYSELCSASNHIGPLHTCDFYRSREAGRILRYSRIKKFLTNNPKIPYFFSDLMQQGASNTPSELLKILTKGKTTRLSADALLDFFHPLEAWLEVQNREETIIGWNSNMDDVELFQSLVSSGNYYSGLISLITCSVVSCNLIF